MSYLRINVDSKGKEFVEQLLLKLGNDVKEEEPVEKVRKTKPSRVSPTFLFGKWKGVDIDPTNHRKDLWARRK